MRPQITAAALLLAPALLLLPASAWAGAWPEGQGQWLLINSVSYYQVSLSGYNTLGEPSGTGTYRQVEASPYLEYGATDRLTLGLQPRLQEVSQSGLPGTKSDFGLVQLNMFARYTLMKSDTDVISVQGQVDVPGAATADVPQLAQRAAEYEGRLLYGHAFVLPGRWRGYVDAEAGYRFETAGWANQIRGDLTLGLSPSANWQFLAQNFNTISTGPAARDGADYDLSRVELSVVHNLTPRVAIQLGAWRDVGGRHIALGNAGVAALWLRF